MMELRFMSTDWAAAVRDAVSSWPDDAERKNPLKRESYWAYVDRKRKDYRGTIALTVPDAPGSARRCLALTFADGEPSSVEVRPVEEVKNTADLMLQCAYRDWLDIVGGYDIGKAMTYHKLPLVVGDGMALLKVVYFVHEVLLAASRVKTADTYRR